MELGKVILENLIYKDEEGEWAGTSCYNMSVEKINELKPDLIFLDIQMPGMNGFEMLSKLQRIPLIIFCTAYDEYALQAFETNSIDYLLKPVKQERLAKAISKLDKFVPHFNKAEILDFLDSSDLPLGV